MALPISLSINSHEGWICTLYNVREHCYSTRWTFSSCPFILKLCTVWQYFSAFAFSFVSYKPGTWTVYYKYKHTTTEIVCNTCLFMTDLHKHLNKVSRRRFFSHNTEPERGKEEGGEEERDICTIHNFFTFTLL